MNAVDRLFCWLLGHTIEDAAPVGKGVWRCPHCTGRITDIEFLEMHGVTATLAAIQEVRRLGGPGKYSRLRYA